MRCANCSRDIPQSHYCPHCGIHQPHGSEHAPSLPDGRFFSEMMQQFQRMLRDMGLDDVEEKELIDLSKAGKRRSGFTINIVQSGGGPPQIRIQPIGEAEGAPAPSGARAVSKPVPKRFAEARRTEEPETVVRRVGNALIVDMELPSVKHESDIAVTELDQSIEVRALAGDKAYFKIITKPAQLKLAGQKFKNGKLHLEFA